MESSKFENLLLSKVDGVAVVTLDRPDAANAFTLGMRKGLVTVFNDFRDDPSVRAVVVTGAGKAFSAGGDVKGMQEFFRDPAEGRQGMRNVSAAAVLAISTLEKPVIAMVNGPAIGAGCSIALMCDLIVASDQATFGFGFIKIGMAADWGAGYFLPRRIGMTRAKELLILGKTIDAREAQQIGLVNLVVPHSELESTTMKMAVSLAASATRAIGSLKTLVDRGLSMDLHAYLEYETYVNPILSQTEDHREGARAFAEKRRPHFKGI